MRSCKECEYEIEETCRRYPPIVLPDLCHTFPSLRIYDEGCGEFKLKSFLATEEFGELMDRINRGE